MKVIIATDVFAPTPGGEPVALDQLARGLSRHRHEVHVIAPADGLKSTEEKDPQFYIHRIGSLPINKKRRLRLAYDVSRVKRLIGEIKPDIVHITTGGPIAKAAAAYCHKKHIALAGTAHILKENLLSPYHLPKIIEEIVGGLMMKRLVTLFKGLDVMSAPSPYAASRFEKEGIRKVIAISNGLHVDRFARQDLSKQKALRKKFNIPSKTIVFYLGRLDREKRVDVLLNAVSLIGSNADFCVLIGGIGVEEKKLKAMVGELNIGDKVIFLENIEHEALPDFYHLADIFVMPGDAELQSIATLEAMASGLPIIACNALALPDLVTPGVNGYLYKRNDPEDLAKHLLSLLKNKAKRSKMGAESLRAVGEHDIERVIDKYEAMYEGAIKRRKSSIVDRL